MSTERTTRKQIEYKLEALNRLLGMPLQIASEQRLERAA